jgi:transcriptional regulator with XRE-family HTH domain
MLFGTTYLYKVFTKDCRVPLDIGSAIRIVRQAKELKLGTLAEAAGVSIAFMSLVENGGREPSLAVIRRVANALDVPVEALMVLAQPAGSRLQTSNAKAKRLADSIQQIADAEDRLRKRLDGHGGQCEAERSSA